MQLQKMCTVGSDGKTVLNTKYLRILKVIDEVCLAILYISIEKPIFCTRVFQNIRNLHGSETDIGTGKKR
jgi:hypothetical protein